MSSPNPLPSSTPSTSTVLSVALGAPVAILIAWILDVAFKVQMPAEVSAAIGVIVSSAVGYFGNGGKAADTK